jgi:membrane fusion protein (multidrug efflux system)
VPWRRWLPPALVLIAGLGPAGCGKKSGSEEGAAPAEVPTIVAEVATVGTKNIVDELVVRGIIVALPNQDVKVSSQIAGRVTSVTVAEGDSVKQGQVVAQLDRRLIDDQRRQSAAALEQAKAQVENARLNLQRNQQLFERGIAAGKEVEDARTQMAAAQSSLEQATAALSTADRNLEFSDVHAPITGQVVKRLVSVGEQVDGTAALPILEVANLDRVEVAANVPAEHLGRIKVNQIVTVSSDAYADRPLQGTIIAIAPAVDATTNAALVRIRVDNPERRLRVGMFAEAHVTLAERHNAVVVPPAAVVRDERGAAVYVVKGDTAERTAVKTGLEKPDLIEILSGVTVGQSVLVSSVYGLGEKAKLAK